MKPKHERLNKSKTTVITKTIKPANAVKKIVTVKHQSKASTKKLSIIKTSKSHKKALKVKKLQSNIINNENFSLSQQQAIATGTAVRKHLLKVVNEACDRQDTHTYIYSMPGFGKTYTVTQALEKKGLDYYTLMGNTSMFAFCLRLAVIDDAVPKDQKIIILVDDCDEILSTNHNGQNINIIKAILGSERIMRYEKSMAALKSSLTDEQLTAIDNHANPNSLGFEVDCSNMTFIFTSNKMLPTKTDIELKPSTIKNHLHAIRSRCYTEDFNYPWETMWGWLVDIVLHLPVKNVKNLTDKQKLIMVTWIYNNWSDMKEADIRTCEKMASTMLNAPKDYLGSWELSYLNR